MDSSLCHSTLSLFQNRPGPFLGRQFGYRPRERISTRAERPDLFGPGRVPDLAIQSGFKKR